MAFVPGKTLIMGPCQEEGKQTTQKKHPTNQMNQKNSNPKSNTTKKKTPQNQTKHLAKPVCKSSSA